MRRATFIILALATLFSHAYSDGDPGKKSGKRERGGGRPGAPEMMKRLDTDKNGEISLAEFSASERIQSLDETIRKKLFDRLDKNDDGVISKNELKPPHGGPGFPPIEKLDVNKDRQVSFEEFSNSPKFKQMPPERVRRIFDRLDRNKDGFLNRKDHVKPDPGRRGKKGGVKGFDLDGDDRISRGEFRQSPMALSMPEEARMKLFKKLDKNSDDFLDAEELRELRKKKPKK